MFLPVVSGFRLTLKNVALLRQPVYERQKSYIQDEIHQLELEESTLTSVQSIRKIVSELKMVEPTETSQVIWTNSFVFYSSLSNLSGKHQDS